MLIKLGLMVSLKFAQSVSCGKKNTRLPAKESFKNPCPGVNESNIKFSDYCINFRAVAEF